MPRGGSKPGERRGGRQKGTPNKLTSDVRQMMGLLAERNVPKLEKWITRTAIGDPGKAAELLLRALEFHVPKLGRTEVEHSGGIGVTLEQLVPKRKPAAEGER